MISNLKSIQKGRWHLSSKKIVALFAAGCLFQSCASEVLLESTSPKIPLQPSATPIIKPIIEVEKLKLNPEGIDPYAIVELYVEPQELNLHALEVAKVKVLARLASAQTVEIINHSKIKWQMDPSDLLSELNGTIKALKPGESDVRIQVGGKEARFKVKILPPALGEASTQAQVLPELLLVQPVYRLAIGEKVQLQASLKSPDGSESKDLLYSVDHPELFELNSESGSLRRIKAGAATVTVQARLNGNILKTIALEDKVMESPSSVFAGTTGPTASPLSAPTSTFSPIPTPSVVSTPATVVTSVPLPTPTSTPVPLPTPTPVPLPTPTPVPLPTPTALPAPTPTPTPSPLPTVPTDLTGKIVYASFRNGDSEIFIMNADGTNPIQLTNNNVEDIQPDLSPNGQKIVFETYRDGNAEIYVMNADGSNLVNLSQHSAGDYEPDWSPDGTKIAFSSHRQAGDKNIFVMNSDGSNITYLTNTANSPDWSPDGTKIVFASVRNYPNWDIYIYDLQLQTTTNLTNSPDKIWDQSPVWSPDGARIAFASQYIINDLQRTRVHMMNVDGSNVVRYDNLLYSYSPAWSPNGLKLVCKSDSKLKVFNADFSGQAVTLTSNSTEDDMPSWR